jgi:hypothetical protein
MDSITQKNENGKRYLPHDLKTKIKQQKDYFYTYIFEFIKNA